MKNKVIRNECVHDKRRDYVKDQHGLQREKQKGEET